MKKNFVAILMMTAVLSGTGTVFAADTEAQGIQLDGSFSVQYRDQHDKNTTSDMTRTAWKSTLTLNANAPLADNLSLYTTFNYQTINTNANPGFVADYVNSKAKDNAGISAFGLTYKNGGYTYVVGSQALTLGAGLAYDNGYIGKNALPYALNISKKIGATDLTVIAAQTNYQSGIENDKFYALQGSYQISPVTNLGAMLAHVSYGKDTKNKYDLPDSDVAFYSIYSSTKLSKKWNLSTEYLLSSTQNDKQAIQTNLSYKADKKNTVSAGYYRAEDQTSIVDYNQGGLSTTPNNNTQGYVVAWKHDFTKNFSWKVADVNYKRINDSSELGAGSNRNRFYTTATVTF